MLYAYVEIIHTFYYPEINLLLVKLKFPINWDNFCQQVLNYIESSSINFRNNSWLNKTTICY